MRSGSSRGLIAVTGVLVVLVLCLAGLGIAGFVAYTKKISDPGPPPAASEFFGDWCSGRGDVLHLRAGRFTIAPMSAELGGQITIDSRTEFRRASAAGSWQVGVLGADLFADQSVTIDAAIDRIDGRVASGALEFDVFRQGDRWALSRSELVFTACGS